MWISQCFRPCGPIEHIYDYIVRLELCYCGNRVRPPRVRFCSFFCQERASRAEAYGLTGATYLALMVGQGGSCALCGRTFELEVLKPVIDHDHRTGFVRGLL